jgi:hypothetical protein
VNESGVSEYGDSGANVIRTLVVDGVTDGEDSEDRGKDWGGRRVLSGKELGLQSSKARLRSWSLWEFRVKVDEGSKASSRPSGLNRRKRSVVRGHEITGEFSRRTRRVGEATLGGTMPPSWRRTREGCIIISESVFPHCKTSLQSHGYYRRRLQTPNNSKQPWPSNVAYILPGQSTFGLATSSHAFATRSLYSSTDMCKSEQYFGCISTGRMSFR